MIGDTYTGRYIEGIAYGPNNLLVPYIGDKHEGIKPLTDADATANQSAYFYGGPYKANTVKYENNTISTQLLNNFDTTFDAYKGSGIKYKSISAVGPMNANYPVLGTLRITSGYESQRIFARVLGIQVRQSLSTGLGGCGLSCSVEVHEEIDNISPNYRRKLDLFYEFGVGQNDLNESSGIYFATAPMWIQSQRDNSWLKNCTNNTHYNILVPVTSEYKSYDTSETGYAGYMYTSGFTGGWQLNRSNTSNLSTGKVTNNKQNFVGYTTKFWLGNCNKYSQGYGISECWFSSTSGDYKSLKNLHTTTLRSNGYGDPVQYNTSIRGIEAFKYSPTIRILSRGILSDARVVVPCPHPYYPDHSITVDVFYDFIKA